MQRRGLGIAHLVLSSILIVAATLRLDDITQPFIDATSWRQTDVASIADQFWRGHSNIFYPRIGWNGPGDNYVGYEFQTVSYLAALLYRLVGHHDWVGRGVAAAFGVWGVFAFYKLVTIVWSREHASFAAGMLAILPGQVYVDRSFLPDPVMMSLVLTSSWLLVRVLRTERLRDLALAVLTGVLGILTKVSGAFAGLALAYAILSTRRRVGWWKTRTRMTVAAIAVLVPVVAYYAWALHLSKTYPPYYGAASDYWIWKFGVVSFVRERYFLPRLYAQLKWFVSVPAMVLCLAGLATRPPQSQWRWFFHWWFAGFAVFYAIGARGLVANPTNLNLISPAVAACTSLALYTSYSVMSRNIGRMFASVSVGLLIGSVLVVGYIRVHEFGFRSWAESEYALGRALGDASRPGDLVVAVSRTLGDTTPVYYSEREGWPFPPAFTWSSSSIDRVMSDDQEQIRLMQSLVEKGATWFGVVADQRARFSEQHPALHAYLSSTFDVYREDRQYTLYRLASPR